MFSFHRPKVYRSTTGCCICKAKSSSSRFTDSKKYEEDFLKCFQLNERRQGEICNACVLLVKRWKKLPAGTDRNWSHVVDARAGPGMKSLTKFKSKTKRLMLIAANRGGAAKKLRNGPETMSGGDGVDCGQLVDVDGLEEEFAREYSPALSDSLCCDDVGPMSSGGSSPSRRGGGYSSDGGDEEGKISRRTRHKQKKLHTDGAQTKSLNLFEISDFLDMDYWKSEEICCGIVFRGRCGELALDQRFLKDCSARKRAKCQLQLANSSDTSRKMGVEPPPPPPLPPPPSQLGGVNDTTVNVSATSIMTTSTVNSKVFSDNSSDSGYDDSSNQSGATTALADNNNTSSDNNNLFDEKHNSSDDVMVVGQYRLEAMTAVN